MTRTKLISFAFVAVFASAHLALSEPPREVWRSFDRAAAELALARIQLTALLPDETSKEDFTTRQKQWIAFCDSESRYWARLRARSGADFDTEYIANKASLFQARAEELKRLIRIFRYSQ